MCMSVLDHLKSEEFALSVGFPATPIALCQVLRRTEAVHNLRRCLEQGAVSEETIRAFVSALLAGFRVGQRFEHETVLAALAVVLERRPTDFAEEFLLDLAKLKLAEMSRCIRVARECLKHRVTITQNKGKDFQPWTWPNRLSFQQVGANWLGSTDAVQTIGQEIDMRPSNAKA